MKSIIIILTLITIINVVPAQYPPNLDSYSHYHLIKKVDTIKYHIYSKLPLNKNKGIVVYLHGSGSEPLFKIRENTDTIEVMIDGIPKKKLQKSMYINSSVPFDLDRIPDSYAFVVISKTGIPFSVTNSEFTTPKIFFEKESLDHRVYQADEVINYILKKQCKNAKNVVVIGHSEGSDVAAKLATKNKKITHLGYWSGGGPTQYYDFALFIRNEVNRGNLSEEEAIKQLDSLIKQAREIANEPNNIDKKWYGHSYQRWASFTEPSINNLLKVKIPIFIAMGSKDTAVPIESAYYIPIEFARHKKDNLTFKVYPELDHSFNIPPKKEGEEWQVLFMDIFLEMMNWVETIRL